jgi:glycosyltransferase involved in cell wall biosynthesis
VDGGVGRHVADLFSGLSGGSHDVLLAGPAVPGSTLGGGELSGDPKALRSHFRLDMERAIHPGSDLRALSGYLALVRRVRPDLIHAHSSKAGALARLGRLVLPRIPVVYTPHGYAFAGFFEHELERIAYREAERGLAPLTSLLLAVCEAEARVAASVGLRRRTRVVHNGISLAESNSRGARPTAPESDAGSGQSSRRDAVIATVARLQSGKGLEALIDAMPEVCRRHPSARLHLIGGGPLADVLRNRAQILGVAEVVEFCGELADPRRALAGAQLFVLPSLAESFPYVVLEAMAAGVPIVATRVGGIPEAVVDGQSGILIAPGSSSALAQAIVSLLDDPGRRASLAVAAGRRVRSSFGLDQMIAGTVAVYEEVLDRARTR